MLALCEVKAVFFLYCMVGDEIDVRARLGGRSVFARVIAHHERVRRGNACSAKGLLVIGGVRFDGGCGCLMGGEDEIIRVKAGPAQACMDGSKGGTWAWSSQPGCRPFP